MVGDKPKFRMVKAKKRRGIKALGRRRAIGGMERQILNPATGKYVAYLGPKQEMRLYSHDALAKIEKKEGARKIKAAEIKKKAATPKAAPKKTPKVETVYQKPVGNGNLDVNMLLNKLLNKMDNLSVNNQVKVDDVYGYKTNAEMYHWVKENLNFDQMIWEFGTDMNPNWVHISYVSEEDNRNRCLKAYKDEYNKTKYKTI